MVELSAGCSPRRQFWAQVSLDIERMPKVRRYLKDRRRRPALAAARLRLEKLVALPHAGVVEAAVRAVPPSDSTKKWLKLLNYNAAYPHPTSLRIGASTVRVGCWANAMELW